MSRTTRMLIEAGCLGAVVAVLLLPAPATADNLRCGPGTVKDRNVCLPNYALLCGAGTQLVNGQCVAAPKQQVCGDGVVDVGEVCDDGNTVTEVSCPYGQATCTACSADCSTVLNLGGPFCGDGMITNGEQCDDGNTCTEGCPYGTASCFVCSATCTLVTATGSFCGDGVLDTAQGEECDDGNVVSGDGCSATCRTEQP